MYKPTRKHTIQEIRNNIVAETDGCPRGAHAAADVLVRYFNIRTSMKIDENNPQQFSQLIQAVISGSLDCVKIEDCPARKEKKQKLPQKSLQKSSQRHHMSRSQSDIFGDNTSQHMPSPRRGDMLHDMANFNSAQKPRDTVTSKQSLMDLMSGYSAHKVNSMPVRQINLHSVDDDLDDGGM